MLIPRIYPVTCHTDHVGPGSVFVAIKGFKDDGSKYIQVALERGASTIVVQYDSITQELQKLCQEYNAELITVKNTRAALAELASAALDNPASKLKIIGVTGTKGKTTTTYIIEHILRKSGYKTALIGTIKNKILDQEVDSERTTPESDYLHMFFAECVNNNVDYVVMEVSSHALSLDRVHGITFHAAGFTNLAPEHMDFYKDLEDYFNAKIRLFSQVQPNAPLIINTDDTWGKRAHNYVLEKRKDHKNIFTFGVSNSPDILDSPVTNSMLPGYTFEIKQNSLDGLRITIKDQLTSYNRHDNTSSSQAHPTNLTHIEIHASKLFGEFNCYNLIMSVIMCKQLGISDVAIREALEYFQGVPGRLQLHTLKNGARAFIDYAHNPSSFEQVLKTLRNISEHLIIVFGCGGDRDTTKRPIMGALAAQFGDKVIVTDDNPRYENRETIIQDIIAGIPGDRQNIVICQPDRKKAIKMAATLADADSVIALLGKGHEAYYCINGQTLHFDDLEEIKQY